MLCIFTGDWSHRDSPSSMSQDSKLPEEKQVFAMNHSVWTGALGKVSHSYQEMVGTFLNPELPDASHRPTVHTGLSKDNRSQDHNVSPFCMDTPTPYPRPSPLHTHNTQGPAAKRSCLTERAKEWAGSSSWQL